MRHLFIDRQHVLMLHNVRQVFYQPAKDPAPVLVPDQPWEDDQVRVDSAPVWDAARGVWRLWYAGGAALLPLYAESRDGISWDKPALGRAVWQGAAANNIVRACKAESPEHDEPTPHSLLIRDDREADAARRFKGMSWIREKGVGSFLVPHASPDGFDWAPLPGDRIPCEDTKFLADDPLRRRYVATVKGLHGYGVRAYGAAELGRIVYLSLSEDFAHWTEPRLVFWADERDRELGAVRIEAALRDRDRLAPGTIIPSQFFTDIYWMPVFAYEDLYLALPVLFHQSGRYFLPSGASNQDGLLFPTLAASRDLMTWDRLTREPFLPLSPLSNRALFDHGMILAAPPVLQGGDLCFYYTGYRCTHLSPEGAALAGQATPPGQPTHAIFRARLRRDGFASLSAGDAPGLVLTQPVTVTGPALRLNVRAARGEVRVELRDARTGRAIPGYGMGDYLGPRVLWSDNGKRGALRIGPGARFEDDPEANDTVPIARDAIDLPVAWKQGGDLSALAGREVRLFFFLRNADLFSFWFDT